MIQIKRSELVKLALDKFGDSSLESQNKILIMASTGLCARTSYITIGDDKVPSIETLIGIHDKMVAARPRHSSPMEHCSKVPTDAEYYAAIKTTDYPVLVPRNDKDLKINGGIVNKELYPQHPGYSIGINQDMYGWFHNFRGFIPYRHILEQTHQA